MAENTEPRNRAIVTLAEARAAGLRQYFTGKPCMRGHVSERNTHNHECVECHNVARNKRRAEARSLIPILPMSPRLFAKKHGIKRYFTGMPCARGHIADRLVSNLGCVFCQNDKRSAARDVVRGRPAAPIISRDAVAKNRAAGLKNCFACHTSKPLSNFADDATRHDLHQPRCRECTAIVVKKWRLANPVKLLVNMANRRARQHAGGGRHTVDDILLLMKIQRGKCAHSWCRISLAGKRHIDHIIPLARGGSNGRRNLQFLCQPCNNRKSDKHPIDFAQKHGMLL